MEPAFDRMKNTFLPARYARIAAALGILPALTPEPS
jgi:hypothetical protein